MGLLEGTAAVAFGGSGAVGGATARAFAREGASVPATGMTAREVDEIVGRLDEMLPAAGGCSPARC